MDNLKIVIDHLQDCIDYMDRDRTRHWVFVRGDVVRAAFQLLKEQDGVIQDLLKVGYPHNFQREKPWIVNYMYAITNVIKKAVRLNNG